MTITGKEANDAVIVATTELFTAAIKMRRTALKYKDHASVEVAQEDNQTVEYVVDGAVVDRLEVLESVSCSADYMKAWVDMTLSAVIKEVTKDPDALAKMVAELLDAKRN